MTIEQIAQRSKNLLAENERLRKALDDLVALKDYRDWHGKTPDYLEKKPLAWQQARDALATPDTRNDCHEEGLCN